MLNKSRSLSASRLAVSSPNSPNTSSPSSVPVLGDFYRSQGSSKNPLLPNVKTPSKLHKIPRPVRTAQIFNAVKKGLGDCIQCTEDDIIRLKNSEDLGYFSVVQHVKIAERFKKRLEFHLTKIEELEEKYILHQQLWQGVQNMAKAFISFSGSNKKSSLNRIDCGFKECIQMLCAIEASLEGLLGTFDYTLKGLFGFARLIPGDVFEIVVHCGHQKWKSRGKIGSGSQTWDPSMRKFKATISDIFSIKATEVRMLGKRITLGEKNSDTLNLFSARLQEMTMNMNQSSSLKLALIVQWNPLEGVDESTPLPDTSRQRRSSPSRQMIPVRSMIEGDGQLEYWSRVSGASASTVEPKSSSQTNRFSVPCFPSSFSALSPDLSGSESAIPLTQPFPVSKPFMGVRDIHAQAAQRSQMSLAEEFRERHMQKPRPYSSSALDRITERGLSSRTAERNYPGEETKWRRLEEAMDCNGCTRTLGDTLHDLRVKSELMRETYAELNELERELESIDRLLKKNKVEVMRSGRASQKSSSSDVSISVESALDAFSFLDSEDYVIESDRQQKKSTKSHFDLIEERCTLSPESTARTTDSGIESIANQLNDDNIDPAFDIVARSESSSTGNLQVDVALNWHVQYCYAILNKIDSFELLKRSGENSIENLKRQAAILAKLSSIAKNTAQEPDLHQVLNDLTLAEELKQFWLRCIDTHLLYVSTERFIQQLKRQEENLIKAKYDISPREVFAAVVLHIVDSCDCLGTQLIQCNIVTLHQFMDFWNKLGHHSVQNYVQDIAMEVWLCKQLESESITVISRTLRTFYHTLPPNDFLIQLSLMLYSNDPQKRALAVEYLNVIKDNSTLTEKVTTIFNEALENSDSSIRSAASAALRLLQAKK